MKSAISILFFFLLFTTYSQNDFNNISRKKRWTSWKLDTTYYDDCKIQEVTKLKLKSKYLGSTTMVYKTIAIKYDVDGKWYFKQRTRGSNGCFHSKRTIIWTRKRRIPS